MPVEDQDIEEMFAFADKNCDGKLSYSEFEVTWAKLGTHSLTFLDAQVMVNPPQPPEVPKPHISDIGMAPQV